MYSDTWRQDAAVHRGARVAVNRRIDVQPWVDDRGHTVGVCVNFEFADDVHYELDGENWKRVLDEVFRVRPGADFVRPFRAFLLGAENPSLSFREAMDAAGITYQKAAFFDVEDMDC